MNKYVISIFSLVLFAAISYQPGKAIQPPICISQLDTIDTSLFIKGNRTPKLLSNQFMLTEGPAVDSDGTIYFNDVADNKTYKYTTKGQLSLFKMKSGNLSGMYIDRDGSLVACSGTSHQLLKFDSKGQVTTLLGTNDFQPLNGPNDLWINKKGDIYFTDPYYPPADGSNPVIRSDTSKQRVLLLRKGQAKRVAIVDGTLIKPNGIVGTPDGQFLYVADINANKTYRYSIKSDGTLRDRVMFYNKGSDGITLDERGNLYLTGGEVIVVNPKGIKIASIQTPSKKITNLCFGGENGNLLLITAIKEVYVLPMNVKGIEKW
ncbi:MAG: SMP-30/gluconolactonase/LRE family protein [Pedobacter sp.]|nr:MAG: SMP-30/gluconolactonase/LRE family protein [Pedobacter sp.]